jgi:hypothetical protein
MNQKRADQGDTNPTGAIAPHGLTHLQRLEAESIHILREAVAESENPVVLYSIGKDSSVTVHLARKAFHPSAPPFPPPPWGHHLEVPGHVRVSGQDGGRFQDGAPGSPKSRLR